MFGLDEAIPEEYHEWIRNESQEFHDLLIPKVEDNYHTVAIKLLAAFNWISTIENIQWIIKIDDDVLVNMEFLDGYLATADLKKIHCKLIMEAPIRYPDSKWYFPFSRLNNFKKVRIS